MAERYASGRPHRDADVFERARSETGLCVLHHESNRQAGGADIRTGVGTDTGFQGAIGFQGPRFVCGRTVVWRLGARRTTRCGGTARFAFVF